MFQVSCNAALLYSYLASRGQISLEQLTIQGRLIILLFITIVINRIRKTAIYHQ